MHIKTLEQLGRLLVELLMIDHERKPLDCGVSSAVDVFGNRTVGNGLKLLMHHGNSHLEGLQGVVNRNLLSLENDLSGIHLIDAEQAFHQRRFAGAVFPHQGMDSSGADVQIDLVKRLDAGKGLTYPPHFQHIS